jgi:acetyl-CoA acetyltransferase
MSRPAHLRDVAWVTGVGQTDYSRRSNKSELALAVQAVKLSIEDAGISIRDVDGLITYQRLVPVEDVAASLGISDLRFAGTSHLGGASSVEGIMLAALALQAGVAQNIVVYCARNGSSGSRISERVLGRVPGRQLREQLEWPYGLSLPAQWLSLVCRRHMHEFGTTRDQMGLVAVAMRDHAQLNSAAMRRGHPITMVDYMASEPVAEPYNKLDCCLESDGAAAVVLSTADRARAGPKPAVAVAGVAVGQPQSQDDLIGRQDWFASGVRPASKGALAMAGVTPADFDVAMIYDCFTFEVIHQLEEMGFCAPGEGGPFVASGAIHLGGTLPVNPHGGLLAEAHMMGMNHVIEATRQLRSETGERQVVGARLAAVTGWGGLGDGAVAVLRAN